MNALIKKLFKEIALISETSYRRGFQHGVNASIVDGIDDSIASDYRFRKPKTKAINAPERLDTGKVFYSESEVSILERIMTLELVKAPMLRDLYYDEGMGDFAITKKKTK